MPGAYHELSKEPNNHFMFEASLRFMGERLADKEAVSAPKPFGKFMEQIVRYYRHRPLVQRRKFWIFILAILYFIIGFFIARKLRLKRKILTWPLAFLPH